MKPIFKITAVFLLPFMFAVSYASTKDASDVVRDVTSQLKERLTIEKEQLDVDPDKIYEIVDELIVPYFDFPTMSRGVLGKSWHSASEEQRKNFIEQFTSLLMRTYAKALRLIADKEIEFFPAESNPRSNSVKVKSTIKTDHENDNVVTVIYTMHLLEGEWKVVNVAFDAINLIITYRKSFASQIRNDGLDALIANLTERNDTNAKTVLENSSEN